MAQSNRPWTAVLMIISCACFLFGCVTHGEDDRHRKKPEPRKHLPASSPIDVVTIMPGNGIPRDDVSRQAIERGNVLFNENARCSECHGQNGDIQHRSQADGKRLALQPTDLRKPTDKSVRQLYLIIKYGIPGTGMVSIQETAQFSDSDVLNLIAYVLSLQGTLLSPDTISVQRFRRHTQTDRTIERMCEDKAIGDSDLKDDCEDRYAKRYRDLIVGRPPDIPADRYIRIESRCKRQASKDLDKLALCYRTEYMALRQARIE